ncbi:MAG TPA: alpha-2-macroglobulin family protein [Thermoanaerobaculia bacterium]|nr:alpha-2-macroglobulin family protein [Thermoanaerobaculia bacterium]
MRRIVAGSLVAMLTLVAFAAATTKISGDYDAVRRNAERLVSEGSYKLALEAYETIDRATLPEEQRRWIEFRLADLRWRSAAEGDAEAFEEAARALERLLRDDKGRDIRDRVWAEAQESLGDLWWLPRNRRNWGAAWQRYAAALDWWAGSRDLEQARSRYLGIVWKATDGGEEWAPYGHYGSNVPIEILENSERIAVTPNDRSHASYLIAMQLVRRRDAESVERTRKAFELAIAAGKSSAWYDDALAHYGQWLETSGTLSWLDDDRWLIEPDYEAAVAAYRRLLSDHRQGETRYWDQAKQRLDAITKPSLALTVSNVFLPGSKAEFQLQWRNVGDIELSMAKVDLTADLTNWTRSGIGAWYEAIDSAKGRERFAWRKSVTGREYVPGSERVTVDRTLSNGAWLLEARSGGEKARELIVVTDAAVVARTSPSKTLVWITDARSGAPIAGAKVSVWTEYWELGSTRREQKLGTTDADGIVEIALRGNRSGQMLVLANAKDRQAFSMAWGHGRGEEAGQWRIYAATDRPAYRPGETAKWKITARVTSNSGYAVPSGREVTYEIFDPRGTSVAKGTLTLNAFGSAWSELPLDSSMPLGEYRVDFADARSAIGSATLFRLEEYKLPEFRVDVKTAGRDGVTRAFRLGDTVEVTIEASYYFGGPVANATIESVVHQSPWFRSWIPERDYPWYFDMPGGGRGHYGRNEQIVKRETLTTDAGGKATLTFDTPAAGGQDFEYRIEARVTDASRREIVAEKRVRVTRTPYFVDARPKHWLYKPGDTVEVTFRAVDANDHPVRAEGTSRITREEWKEVWLDPKGNEVSGRQLEALRAREAMFPPPPQPGQHPWLLKSRGYEQEEILVATVKTDESGRAVQRFTPTKEGYYRFHWSSRPSGLTRPRPRDVVEATTTVWVATKETTRLGYFRAGGVEILIDDETVRPGATVPAMLVVPTSDRWVLFAVEGEEIMSRQLVRTTGNVKLIELKLGDEHIPNVFLTASMVMDLQLHQDTKEIIVPPVRKFLSLDVTADREEYQPREEATLTVTARDAGGKPVTAEVSLGVADESVYAIQQDYAGDPRPFFYGRKRPLGVQTASSFMQKPYVRLVELTDGRLVDERVGERESKDGFVDEGSRLRSMAAVGGAVSDMAVAESIAVSAASPAAPVPAPALQMAKSARNEMQERDASAAAGEGPAVVVRSDFRSTVFWKPDVVTGADGTATVKVTWPDSLTTWRATARAATVASQFGIATASTRTKKPLIVRLQAPRFFVVGDETVVSAVVNNNTDRKLTVAPSLEASGVVVTGLYVDGAITNREASPIDVDPAGEGRIDWVVRVKEPGVARLRVTAKGGGLSDAMERTYPVEDHGIEKLIAVSGKLRGDEATLKLEIPRERRSTAMVVQVTPSLAVTMLDALPYLIDFPYGCTEQTMSRFLPAVIVAKTLADLGIPRETVATRLFGGIEAEHASKTQPKGKRDLEKLDEMTRAGLARLYDFQHADGGWGWWKEGSSDHHMSAYVVWGLALARDAGIAVRSGVIDRGVEYLRRELVKEENDPDRQAWMLHALAAAANGRPPQQFERAAIDNLRAKRDRLSSYGLALYALSAQQFGLREQALTLSRNLEDGAAVDRAPDASFLVRGSGSGAETIIPTAHWGARGFWWRWMESPVESTAISLRALAAIDPKHRLIEPSMNWLVKNRRGSQWSNTRDTAMAILALTDYLKASGELGDEVEYEVAVNGQRIATKRVAKSEMISAPSRFAIPSSAVRDGVNLVTVKKTRGGGSLYVAAETRFFSLEEPVRAAGSEIFLKREYERLVGRPTLLKGYVYDKVPMRDGESIRSGERLEVVVTVEVKNDYEYLLLEDLKPAGLEAVELVSGTPLHARKLKSYIVEEKHGANAKAKGLPPTVVPPASDATATRSVYQELRDRKVALFIDRLEQGVWEIRYTLRAEVPGTFHALPLIGGAMYVPEIRGNSDEIRIVVEEAGP